MRNHSRTIRWRRGQTKSDKERDPGTQKANGTKARIRDKKDSKEKVITRRQKVTTKRSRMQTPRRMTKRCEAHAHGNHGHADARPVSLSV